MADVVVLKLIDVEVEVEVELEIEVVLVLAADCPPTLGFPWPLPLPLPAFVVALEGGSLVVLAAPAPLPAVVVAAPPCTVVSVLGTAVHRMPLIEVIENPAGRFALVDMAERKAAPVAANECNGSTFKGSR